jgi:outer membrane protein insertion porin family
MESHTFSPPLQNSASPRHQEPDTSDLDKLRRWQEERITRKLRGEYESAVLHLSELVGCLRPYNNARTDVVLIDQ